MKMTDMRAKARAIFGPAIAEPMPKQPNGAKALQERANARPIPTYKVGGVVKKNAPPQPTAAERAADRKRREEYAKMKVTKEQGAAITRGNRAADIEGGRYKTGGKVQTASDTARKLATEMGGMKKGGKPKKNGLAVMIAIGSPTKGMKDMKRPMRKAEGGDLKKKDEVPVSTSSATPLKDASAKVNTTTGAYTPAQPKPTILQGTPQSFKGTTPQIVKSATTNVNTGVTTPSKFDRNAALQAFNSMARNFLNQGVPKAEIIKQQAILRKLQMDNSSNSMQHQKAANAALAAMSRLVPAKKIATGGPVKKAMGGMAYAKGGEMMKPVKRAQGGAGKVRKGMMTPEGKIIDAMNKVRGK
jgi:hypothetical protein